MIRVGINGLGRIGRIFLRLAVKRKDIQIVGLNDIAKIDVIAHLLKYDSIFGRFNGKVSIDDNYLIIDDNKIKFFNEKHPSTIPWKEVGADVVIESTGAFKRKEDFKGHLDNGAKKVIVSAPADDPDVTIVIGVNEKEYDKSKHNIISNASCTTNCLAPTLKVLNDNFKVKNAYFLTVHAYTNDQRVLDMPHKDLRRARAAGASIIPTSTGAAKAIGKVIPELNGKVMGNAARVPVQDGSVVDLTAIIERPASVSEINNAFKTSAENEMKGIIEYTEDSIVSADIIGNPHSAIFDAQSTMVLPDSNMIRVLAWYDNELGYSARLVDLLYRIF